VQLSDTLELVADYKLAPHFEFRALHVLCPPNRGDGMHFLVESGSEPQVLWQMTSLAQLFQPLCDHLRVVSGW